jgi:hypothetical protein
MNTKQQNKVPIEMIEKGFASKKMSALNKEITTNAALLV